MDGILVLAKPHGPTSHDMVALVRRLSGTRRVGHGGTLDPFASGVLPIFLGQATRVVEFHLGARKRYRATVCFGAASTTDDLESELTPVMVPGPTRIRVEAALGAFRGEILQRPPAYSAIKVGGRRAYAIARGGETPTLAARTVTIHELTLVDWDETDPARPIALVDVACSAGTYIRAIARDLGQAVGNAAYLGALVRTASGTFTLADALSVDRVREAAAAGEDGLRDLLRPIDEGLDALPVVHLTAAEQEAVVRGQFVRPASGIPRNLDAEAVLRLVNDSGRLVALGRVNGQRIAPDKVLVDLVTGPAPSPDAPDAARDTTPDPAPDATLDTAPDATAPDATAPVRASHPTHGTRLVAGLDALMAGDGPLFAVVGVFDGIHRGHAYMIDALCREADARTARPTVITFDAHPDEILLGSAPPILCDPDERLARLAAAGVELTIVQHFDRTLRMTPYREFIGMITRRAALSGLLMTPDAAFGFERHGTPGALSALGAEQGFEVVIVPPLQVAGREVRSSDIRALIAAGDLAGAAGLLGRAYAFVGDRSTAGQRSDAERNRTAVLTFGLPVALPPPGTYRGVVEAAWDPRDDRAAWSVGMPIHPAEPDRARGATANADLAPSRAQVAAEITIPAEPGWVEVHPASGARAAGSRLPASPRLRVTLTV